MSSNLAQYLACLIGADLDLSEEICVIIGNAFMEGKFNEVQEYIANVVSQKMIKNSLTEEGDSDE